MRAGNRPLATRALATALAALMLGSLSVVAEPGMAAFPGLNGDIAHVHVYETIFTMEPDGSSRGRLFAGEEYATPAWSPDGTRLAYSYSTGGSGGLAIFDTRSAKSVRLTDEPSDYNPSWSPDGTRIAFDRDTGDGIRDIFVVNDDGTNEVQLPDGGNGALETDPAWSPDGGLIAFVSVGDSADSRISVMRPNGIGRQDLTSGNLDINPTWSPDGKSIAFARAPLPPPAPFSTNFLLNCPPSQCAPSSVPPQQPASPSSQTLGQANGSTGSGERMMLADNSSPPTGDAKMTIAQTPGNSSFDIYRMNASGTSERPLTTAITADFYPTWSPDGSMIAFQRGPALTSSGGDPVSGLQILPSDIYRMNAADGSSVTALSDTGDESQPDWQAVRPAQVSFAPDLDFGSLKAGETSAPKVATLTNTGTVPVGVKTVTLTGPQATDFAIKADACGGKTLSSNTNCKVSVTFSPTGEGERAATLTVTDNAPGSPHTVQVRGRVPDIPESSDPELTLSPPIGPPGFVTYAHGVGFPPGAEVLLNWDPGIGGVRAKASPAGTFSVPVLVFYKDLLGYRTLVGTSVGGPPFSPVQAEFLARPGTGQPRRLLGRR